MKTVWDVMEEHNQHEGGDSIVPPHHGHPILSCRAHISLAVVKLALILDLIH